MHLCMICGKGFIKKRRISDLLNRQRYFICDSCFKESDINIEHLRIPLDNSYMADVVTILASEVKIYNPYIEEISFVASRYLECEPIIIDKIFINERFIRMMSDVARILAHNLLIITFKMEI